MRLTPGRRPRAALVTTATVIALLGTLLGSTGGATAAPPATTPGAPGIPGIPPVAEEKAAEQALEAVQQALSDTGPVPPSPAEEEDHGRELTLLLRDLYFTQDALEGTDARVAERLLARPPSDENDCGPGDPGEDSGFCVHWVTSGRNAPPLADNDGNGVPDQVDRTREAVERSWQVVVTDGGFRAPPRDTGGPDDRLDVYLNDQGASALYGSCMGTGTAPEETISPTATASYCELDNDYRSGQFPAQTPLKNLRVTAAHEFFHAVQFGYDALEDAWMIEGTAAWVEDEVYDSIDDNLQYLDASPLRAPRSPLDRTKAGLSIYGSWIWWRYLTETFPERGGTSLPIIMRQMWEQAGRTTGPVGVWSVPAVKAALADRGRDLPSTLGAFAAGNRAPRQVYEEGASYPAAPLADSWALRKARRGSGEKTVTLAHLSSATYAFRRGAGITGRWRLRVQVDMPNRATLPQAVVTVVRANGSRRLTEVPLNRKGNGSLLVGFANKVDGVELTLVNAGHEYECLQGTQFACRGGRPLSDGRRSTFRATALR